MTLLPTGTAELWHIYVLNLLPQVPELSAIVPLVIFGTDSGGSKCICVYVVCPNSTCTEFLFKCLLDSPEITSYLLQSMTLGMLHSGYNVFSTDHSSTGSHFPCV